ncbi:hypothetical protein PGT21_005976 [Puccinia graminis f. sp. tritici]|nr:hypothetical protein PGT21_005976 [Puccinia graminis f. sp. tritici]KAA1129951.1 hypothetical protein PGTUg99_010311 [Puccinia graminis f. sp. tritici]
MFPHIPSNRVSTGGSSSSYSRSDAASTPTPHPGGHLDQRGNDCTMSGTTAISGLSSRTAVENDQENTKTSFSRCARDSKHSQHELTPVYPNERPTLMTTQVSSTSIPTSKWRTPWAHYLNRSKKNHSSQGSQSQVHHDPSTQARLEFLGYRQELHRTWDFWSLSSLAFCNVTVLQGAFGSVSLSYAFSGPIMYTVGMLVTATLMVCLNAVFGEMASAFPISGAMFSWTFKLARSHPHLRDWARIISWVVGFLLSTVHLMLQFDIGYQFTRVFTTVVTASGVDWNVTHNVQSLVVLCFIGITGLVSCAAFSRSPLFWKIGGLFTVIAQISVCIALLLTSKKQRSFASLFTTTKSKYNSPSEGWNLLHGWSGVTFVAGSESVAHLTEETKDAAKTAPKAMLYSAIFTGLMQVLCCTCIGMAITPMPHKATGLGIIDAVFAHCPKPVAQFVTISIVLTSLLANVSQFFATSRFFWALARDKAIPMGKMWRKVTSDRRPLRATFLMIGLSMLFSLVSFDPTSASLRIFGPSCTMMLLICYLTPLLIRVISPKDVYDRDGSNIWTLGRYSKSMTWISIIFLTLLLVTLSGPTGYPIDTKTFPYAPFCLVATILISVFFWFVYGRSHYAGPIKSLTTWTLGYEVEIPKQLPNIPVRQEKVDNFDLPRTRDCTTNGRSLANMTTHQRTELDLPQAYCTYDSTGSLWSATESQLPNHSFFHE